MTEQQMNVMLLNSRLDAISRLLKQERYVGENAEKVRNLWEDAKIKLREIYEPKTVESTTKEPKK